MPTLNPRITVTLTPAVALVMRRMSELTGNSQSAMIGELLEESVPIFERMIAVLQAAKDIKGKVRQDIVDSMAGVQERLEQQLGLGLDLLDVESAPLLAAAQRVTRRTAKGGAAVSDAPPTSARRRPPASNRGVTPHPAKASRKGKKAA